MTALRKWLDEEHGRGKALAEHEDVTAGAIVQWADGRIPAERIFGVSTYTKIKIEDLRPDLFKKSKAKS